MNTNVNNDDYDKDKSYRSLEKIILVCAKIDLHPIKYIVIQLNLSVTF